MESRNVIQKAPQNRGLNPTQATATPSCSGDESSSDGVMKKLSELEEILDKIVTLANKDYYNEEERMVVSNVYSDIAMAVQFVHCATLQPPKIENVKNFFYAFEYIGAARERIVDIESWKAVNFLNAFSELSFKIREIFNCIYEVKLR